MKVFVIYAESTTYTNDTSEKSGGVLAVFTDAEKAISYIRKHFKCKDLPYKQQSFRTYENGNGDVRASSYRLYDGPEGSEDSRLILETFETDEASDPNKDIVSIF